jgi:hypothetical protein
MDLEEKRPFDQIDRAIKNAAAEKKEENWLDRFMGTSYFIDKKINTIMQKYCSIDARNMPSFRVSQTTKESQSVRASI